MYLEITDQDFILEQRWREQEKERNRKRAQVQLPMVAAARVVEVIGPARLLVLLGQLALLSSSWLLDHLTPSSSLIHVKQS